ncbi:hypothetical protein THAOC_21049, partial [Thalassiosira oceanica]
CADPGQTSGADRPSVVLRCIPCTASLRSAAGRSPNVWRRDGRSVRGVSVCVTLLCYVMLCYVMLSLLSTKGIVGATTKQIKLISFPFFRARLCDIVILLAT